MISIGEALYRLDTYDDDPGKEDAERASGEIVPGSVYMYEMILKGYTASNVKLIKAVGKEGCVKEINSADFISRHKLKAASSVNTSLKKLIDNELIYKSDEGYIVYDRFMGIWLRQQPF